MPSEQRRALRIAVSFTAAFILAELDRAHLQLTFLAPLAAASLACAPKPALRALFALPFVAWLLVASSGFFMLWLAEMPVVLGLLQLWIFWIGFRLLRRESMITLGLLTLLIFAIVPQTLIRAPDLSRDLANWFAVNVGLACLTEAVTRSLIGGEAPRTPAAPPVVPPLTAAAALLLAVVLTATLQPPAPGAVIVGIIIVLRADGQAAGRLIRARFMAALAGGVAGVAVWEAIWIAPVLPVLAATVLFAAWLFARRIAAGETDALMAAKALNVLAILLGEGLSVFYEDADDRIWTRLAGVIIGLLYVAAILRFAARNIHGASAPPAPRREFQVPAG
jgi:hypothetical protein